MSGVITKELYGKREMDGYQPGPKLPDEYHRALKSYGESLSPVERLRIEWDGWGNLRPGLGPAWWFMRLHEKPGVDPGTGLWLPGGDRSWQPIFPLLDKFGKAILGFTVNEMLDYLADANTDYRSDRNIEIVLKRMREKEKLQKEREAKEMEPVAETLSRVATARLHGKSVNQSLGCGKITTIPGVSPGRSRGEDY